MEIDYIALFVRDLESALYFYRDVLGFEFPYPPKHQGIEGRSGRLKIGLYDRVWLTRLLGDRGQVGIGGYPVLLSMTVPDLERTYAHLLQAGVTILTPPSWMPWGQRLLFLEDPDGNLLEIVQQP